MTIFLTKGFYEHTLSLEIFCFMYLFLDNLSDNQLYILLILFLVYL